jgi:mono/diheme cytochrome c family protein
MQLLQPLFLSIALFSIDAASDLFAAPDSGVVTTRDQAALAKLVFNADTEFYAAKLTDMSADFKFDITNTWTSQITIDRVQTSCGCTVATLPSNPWHIPPGGHGKVEATVNLDGKGAGLLKKTLTFYVSADTVYLGTRVCTVEVNIPEPPAPSALSPEERKVAMAKAKADPQRVFTDPKCSQCHADRGRNKMGEKLYAADCGICHDSPNRESSVPDLRGLKVPTSFSYWKAIIADGKPHTMMPAFAIAKGGPLNDVQIHSLAEYLDRTLPRRTVETGQ